MGISGADADALDAVAAEAAGAGKRLAQGERQLTQALHASPWQGRNAEVFRHQWDHEHRVRIQAAAAFLSEAEDALRRNAAQQRDASGTDGGGRERFSADALGGVTPISLFDFGDSDDARLIKLLLGLIPFVGTVVFAEDMRAFLADLLAGRATAQQFEDRVLDTFGLIPVVGWALAGREAFAIALPDDLEDPVMRILGLDPPIDEAISNMNHLIHGELTEIDPWTMVVLPGPLQLDAHRDLVEGLIGRFLCNAPAPSELTTAFDVLELAAAAAALGQDPWPPLARRIVGPVSTSQVTARSTAEALARLTDRGLVRSGTVDGDERVELHPALAAVLAVLATGTLLIEATAPDRADGAVRSCLRAGDEAALIIDRPEGPGALLFTLTDAPIEPARAFEHLLAPGADGDRPVVRALDAAGAVLAEVVTQDGTWVVTSGSGTATATDAAGAAELAARSLDRSGA